MHQLTELKKVKESAKAECMRCGFCTFFCPIYRESNEESGVARGKIALINEVIDGNLKLTKDLLEKIELCLLCRTCVTNCSAGIETDKIILAARADYAAIKGIPLIKKILFQFIIPRRKLFGFILKITSKLQFLLPVADSRGMVRHLPDLLSGFSKGRNIPSISTKFLRDLIPEKTGPINKEKQGITVGFFAGCGMDYIYPKDAINIIDFLKKRGMEVHFPKRQGCCGIAVFSSGDLNTAKKMAVHNAKVFSQLDIVITGCATCGAMIKHYGEYFQDNKADKVLFESFSNKIRDINEFIIDTMEKDIGELKIKDEFRGKKVTWHDPCHLSRYQDIKEQPRKILKGLKGIEYIEMDEADRCCGMGGSFNITHYDLSQKIAKKKLESIRGSCADIVVTACPGCLVQLNDILSENKIPQRAVHIMNLIRE